MISENQIPDDAIKMTAAEYRRCSPVICEENLQA